MDTRYEIFEELGRNHYSIVHSGRDMTIGRDVAILELHEKFRQDVGRWPAIWAQVRELINAKLENVVPVFGAVEASGWIVMEKMRGNLKQEIARHPLPAAVVRSVLRRVLDALRSYHQHDILHGDVKPANLLFNNDGYVKLAFSPGLQLGGQIPQRHQDFKYLAPELLNQQLGEIGPTLDLYCLGFTAVELLVGMKFDSLFKGVGAQAIDADAAWMRWHSTAADRLPSVATLVPGCPADLVRVIDRMVAKPVAERYRTADEVLADLDEGPHESVVVSDAPQVAIPAAVRAQSDAAPGIPERREPAPAAAKKPASPATAPKLKPFSREWANKKLEDPKIMYTVCALILLPALVYLFYPASPPPAQVKISWTPNDAVVRLDGQDIRIQSGATVPLRPGDHSIQIEKDGYETVKETFAVSAETPQERTFTLKAKQKSASTVDIKLEWNPGNAAAKLDRVVLKQPSGSVFPLTPGKHSIELSIDGYETLSETFVIGEDRQQPLTFVLKKKSAAASSSGLPEGLAPASGTAIDKTLKLPIVAVATRLKNSKTPAEFVLVPAGKFKFGADRPQPSELPANSDEVIERAYYVSKTEVTNEQFSAFATEARLSDDLPAVTYARERVAAGGGREPVLKVTYQEALQFCQWISRAGDLPTEREWERAARGTTGRDFPWGDEASKRAEFARLRADGQSGPCSVDDLPSGQTPEGLVHLLGNAAEWCQDLYEAGYDDVENGFPGIGKNHVIRGASFRMLPADGIRLTWRANVVDAGDVDVGFRAVVRTTLGALKTAE